MKRTMNRSLSWILAILMALSCLTVLPMAVSADAAPTVDGVKDDVYTDAKSLITTKAFSGPNGAPEIGNATEATIKTYYTWDDTTVYVLMEITEPKVGSSAGLLDIVYYKSGTTHDGSPLFGAAGGGAVQATVAGGKLDVLGTNTAKDYKFSDDYTTRTLEVSFPRVADSDGFIVSPCVYHNGNPVITPQSFYSGTGPKVLFNDESTWKQEYLSNVEVTEGPELSLEIDGQKDEAYTDDKMIKVYSAYTTDGQKFDNAYKTYINAWYTWDDDFIYVLMETTEETYTFNGNNKDYVFFRSSTTAVPSGERIWEQTDGGFFGYAMNGVPQLLGVAKNAAVAGGKFDATGDGGSGKLRYMEVFFPRTEGADGFQIAPVVDKTNYYVSGFIGLGMEGAHVVKFDDQSTWTATYGEPFGAVIPEPPEPGDERTPATNCEGIDGVMDDRYSEDRVIITSRAFGGEGKGMIINDKHVYTKTYLGWDDDNNYLLVEFYDPFNASQEDSIRYLRNVNASLADLRLENCPNGGGLTFINGELVSEVDYLGQQLQYGVKVEDGKRSYEIVIPKVADATGLQLFVDAKVSNTYLVRNQTNGYQVQNSVVVNYADSVTHKQEYLDPDVMTDSAEIDAIKAEIAKLPADVASLTLADHEEQVIGIKDAMDAVNQSWLVFISDAEKAAFNAAYEKIIALKAASEGDKIREVEDKIKALPDTVTLQNAEDVLAAQEAADALGDMIGYADQALVEKLNALVASIEKQSAVITIDGVKEDAYNASAAYPITMELMLGTSGGVVSMFPATFGSIYTMADKEYSYIYLEIFDGNGIVSVAEGEEFLFTMHDGVGVYFDPDPSVRIVGVPYKDCNESGDGMFMFMMDGDGNVPVNSIGGKTQFLLDPANFKSFRDGNKYGFELRVPRVEDEESFAVTAVVLDPVIDIGPDGSKQLNMDDSRYITLGEYWAGDYSNYAVLYYDEIPEVLTYLEILDIIDALPTPESIVAGEHEDEKAALKRKIKKAEEALDMLTEEQAAMISQEKLDYMAAVKEALEGSVIPGPGPGPVDEVQYGDVNGDEAVDAKDALLVLQAAVDKAELTDEQVKAADVNGDTEIDAKDALLILQYAVDKIEKFPVEA